MAASAFVSLAIGSIVRSKGHRYKVTHLLNTTSVLAVDVETKDKVALNAAEVTADVPLTPENHDHLGKDLDDIPEEEWARRRDLASKSLNLC